MYLQPIQGVPVREKEWVDVLETTLETSGKIYLLRRKRTSGILGRRGKGKMGWVTLKLERLELLEPQDGRIDQGGLMPQEMVEIQVTHSVDVFT